MDFNRSLTEEETKMLHNLWMNDVSSWMSVECLLLYNNLLKQGNDVENKGKGKCKTSVKGENNNRRGKGPGQQAQQLKKQRFNKVLNDIAVKKRVFMRFVQYPNIWKPSGIHLFLDVLRDLKNRSMEAR